jgi:beta-galactosidase
MKSRSLRSLPLMTSLSSEACLAITLLALLCLRTASANSEIFPAEPAAKSAIDWKEGYFVINGKPTFLTSGEMHYARIPSELWKDRIWRSKMMGFNTMQMYVFWNATEDKEGHWNTEDNLDLDAWLTEVQKAGMYAIVRVGPYSCAEWEHGGFPAWLTAKSGMTVRDSGSDFLKYCDPHLAFVEKIVAKHQIHRGGNVIMVQLENEHPRGWGTDGNEYLQHLYNEARKNGLEVPLFFSGLHHGHDPSGEKPYKTGTSPWFSTEFWTGWFSRYGDMSPSMLQQKIAGTWKIIGFGGAGYDYYMIHGGTDFGYSGDTFMTSYDYSAPIGEAGKFNNFYHDAKRAAWLARSFNDLLTGSHDDPDLVKVDATGVRVSTRTNPKEGSLVILNNFKNNVDLIKLPQIAPNANAYQAPSLDKSGSVTTRVTVNGKSLPHTGSFTISKTNPQILMLNVPWEGGAAFDSICANVLLRTKIRNRTMLVCYGAAGDHGEITVTPGGGKDAKTYDFTYPKDDSVQEIMLDAADRHQALVLVMNTDTTKKTWLAGGKLYIGPSFVLEEGSIEWPVDGGHGIVYTESGKKEISSAPVNLTELPKLTHWLWRDAAPERADQLDCSSWMKSEEPVPMGRLDGFQNRYGWYRTTITSEKEQSIALRSPGHGGSFLTWLNGELQENLDHLHLKKGENHLAIMVKANPRQKWYNFTGSTLDGGYKGIWDVTFTESKGTEPMLGLWLRLDGTNNTANPDAFSLPDYQPDAAWQPANPPTQVKGRNVFRSNFVRSLEDSDCRIKLEGVPGMKMFLNGKSCEAGGTDAKLLAGTNALCLVGDIRKEGTVMTPKLTLWRKLPIAHQPWYLKSGLDGLDETAIIGRVTNWDAFLSGKPWNQGTPSPALPTFWKCTFTYHSEPNIHESIGLAKTKEFLASKGWEHSGHAWLNGHNLGEAPQNEPLYMPECWLKDGENTLVIFDMNGNSPDGVELTRLEVDSLQQPHR